MKYLLLLLCLVISGCDARGSNEPEPKTLDAEYVKINRWGSVLRIVDKEYGVVCYRYRGHSGMGCTKLPEGFKK